MGVTTLPGRACKGEERGGEKRRGQTRIRHHGKGACQLTTHRLNGDAKSPCGGVQPSVGDGEGIEKGVDELGFAEEPIHVQTDGFEEWNQGCVRGNEESLVHERARVEPASFIECPQNDTRAIVGQEL